MCYIQFPKSLSTALLTGKPPSPLNVPTMCFQYSRAQLDTNNTMAFHLPVVLYYRLEVRKAEEDTAAHPDFLPHPCLAAPPSSRVVGLGRGLCGQWGEVWPHSGAGGSRNKPGPHFPASSPSVCLPASQPAAPLSQIQSADSPT